MRYLAVGQFISKDGARSYKNQGKGAEGFGQIFLHRSIHGVVFASPNRKKRPETTVRGIPGFFAKVRDRATNGYINPDPARIINQIEFKGSFNPKTVPIIFFVSKRLQ